MGGGGEETDIGKGLAIFGLAVKQRTSESDFSRF